jgi:hypothetical protein
MCSYAVQYQQANNKHLISTTDHLKINYIFLRNAFELAFTYGPTSSQTELIFLQIKISQVEPMRGQYMLESTTDIFLTYRFLDFTLDLLG